MAGPLRHSTPAFKTLAGPSALQALAKDLDRSGHRRVVVVCGQSLVREAEALAAVTHALGERVVGQFADVKENSPIPSVLQARDVLLNAKADVVVAVGGGSAIVTARAAIVLAAEDGDVRELSTHRGTDGRLVSPRLAADKIPLWVIPSTPTTAYAKAGAAVRDPDTGERFALFDPKVRARGVVLDDHVALTAPSSLVLSSALNGFAMCVDGLQASFDPLADAGLRHALRLFATAIPEEADGSGDVEGRVTLMLAALLAGAASDHVGSGLAQPLSHAVGPRATVGNGVVEALFLPHTMRFNLGVTDDGLRAVAETLSPREDPSPTAAIEAVESILSRTGLPQRLRDVGVKEEDFDTFVEHVGDDWAAGSVPKKANDDDLRRLLASAW